MRVTGTGLRRIPPPLWRHLPLTREAGAEGPPCQRGKARRARGFASLRGAQRRGNLSKINSLQYSLWLFSDPSVTLCKRILVFLFLK